MLGKWIKTVFFLFYCYYVCCRLHGMTKYCSDCIKLNVWIRFFYDYYLSCRSVLCVKLFQYICIRRNIAFTIFMGAFIKHIILLPNPIWNREKKVNIELGHASTYLDRKWKLIYICCESGREYSKRCNFMLLINIHIYFGILFIFIQDSIWK